MRIQQYICSISNIQYPISSISNEDIGKTGKFLLFFGLYSSEQRQTINKCMTYLVSQMVISDVKRESANFFCKEIDSKYLRFCRPLGLCYKYFVQQESSCKQYINKCIWLCSSKTLFIKVRSGPDLIHCLRPQFIPLLYRKINQGQGLEKSIDEQGDIFLGGGMTF